MTTLTGVWRILPTQECHIDASLRQIHIERRGADGVFRTHVVRHCSKFSPKTEVVERVLEIRM